MFLNLLGEKPAITWEGFYNGDIYVGVILFSAPVGNKGGVFAVPRSTATVIELEDGKEQVLQKNIKSTLTISFEFVTATEIEEVDFFFRNHASGGGFFRYFPNQDTSVFYYGQWSNAYNASFNPTFKGWDDNNNLVYSFVMEVLLNA